MKKNESYSSFGRLRRPCFVLAFVASALGLSSRAVFAQNIHYKETFPKIGAPYIGSALVAGDPVREAQLAKHDLIILNFWHGRRSLGKTLEQCVQDIKGLNPDILIGDYTSVMEATSNPNDTATQDLRDKLFSSVGPNGIGDWWARDNTGAQLSSTSGQNNTNLTAFVTPDGNGDQYPQWFAKRCGNDPSIIPPSLDFWFSDNAFYRPRVTADWNRDGINDNRDDPAVRTYYRQGIASYWTAINQLTPDKFILANVDGNGSSAADGYLNNAEYRDKIPGAMFESAMGLSFSEETFAGWHVMMGSYRRLIDNTAPPHIVIFNAKSTTDTDYAFMRYGLASCLMEDGYFGLSVGSSYARPETWFDEYDLELGHAVDGSQRTAYQNGVFRRRFEGGMAIVNPKGNGTQTITIEPGFRRFVGTQDPVTNNGQPITSVTLADRQGLILVRNKAPVANAGLDQAVESESNLTAEAILDGRASSDPEGDALTYTWTWNGGSATGDLTTATLPFGSTVVTLTVDDGAGGTATDTVTINVVDTTAPAIISLTPSKAVLWPANHKMVAIDLHAVVTDSVDPTPVTRIISITSNEAVNGNGDGNTSPDWEITGNLTANLRAERAGSGNGREYALTVESVDATGNRSTSVASVSVPHNP